MRIAVLSLDTRGGIQPYLALSPGLQRAGHDVRMVAPSDFAALIDRWGVPARPRSGYVEAALRASRVATERGRLASIRCARDQSAAMVSQWTREVLVACDGVEVMTGGVGGMVAGLSVAEKLGLPFVETHLQPIGAPTSSFPGVLFPGIPGWLGAPGRRLGHALTEVALWTPFKDAMERARSDVLGLPKPSARARPAPRSELACRRSSCPSPWTSRSGRRGCWPWAAGHDPFPARP
jgi:UDP:flavonoid glycosyltransferase YjiC (YdhE family)